MNSHAKYIEALAQKAVTSISADQPPIPVDRIAEKFGLKIVYFDLKSVPGLLRTDKMVIGVNEKDSEVRKRFTIAHELGHFLLEHSNRRETDMAENYSEQRAIEEREANLFASQVLMPENMLREKVKDTEINLKHLASTFNVSEQAITIRLLSLGLIK